MTPQPPFPRLGIGWLLAILVLLVWLIVLVLHLAAPSELVPISFILLALALLL